MYNNILTECIGTSYIVNIYIFFFFIVTYYICKKKKYSLDYTLKCIIIF